MTSEDVDKVYELRNGTSSVGFFRSVEGAKVEAEKILDSYREFDGDNDVEPIDFDAKWEMKKETFGSGRYALGDPKPTLVYGQTYGTAFRVLTHKVDP